LNASHPDRDRFEWRALQRGAAAWVVVKGPRRRIDPLTATTEAAEKPAQPDEPWSGPVGDLPGYR
ncbi:MAG TPA: hypothetical protein VH247_11425, partial [Thermoleophilaceae bacterium]|nr:hypothetical protein [Thermoleophilaceae bacterium]